MDKILKTIEIKNRRASFDFAFLETYIAGMVLKGSEIKSIRQGKANLSDSYCVITNGEIFVRNLQITEYEKSTHYGHEPGRDRKLLLNGSEIKKLEKKLKDQGLTIVPVKLFINEKGFAKLEIALAKGKKAYDKREDIKKKDIQREISRKIK
ncbi:MAG: SsrA-binding protein SmpB [Bacteroidota bacterium]|jgi:SsrA-binding protein